MPRAVLVWLARCAAWLARFERSLRLLALTLLLASQLALPVRADNDAAFQRAISQAVEAFESGQFASAQRHFREAHALAPSARTLRALGMVGFELHEYTECVGLLEQALAARVKPLDAALRREAQAVLGRAQKLITSVQFVLSPGDAQLSVDGVPVLAQAGQPTRLNPGPHALALRAPGRKPLDRSLTLQPGETRTLTLALEPESAPAAATRAKPPLYKNPWLWSGVGVLVLGAATGLAVGLSRDDGTQPLPAPGGDTGAVLTGP